MRKLLKSIFINAIALALTAYLFPGFSYGADFYGLILISAGFTAINFLIRPVIKILLLPINLLTLGAAGFLTNVVCLFILTIIFPQINIRSYDFPGAQLSGFVIPAWHFSILLSLIFASLIISLITNFADWLLNRN